MSQVEDYEVNEEFHKRNLTIWGLDLNPIVSGGAALLIILFSGWALMNLSTAQSVIGGIQEFIVSRFDWVFILSSNFFIAVCFYLACTRLGNVRIGGVEAKPEFSNFAWYSMLISAGMGIGLMFWAVGEPLHHMDVAPPIFSGAESEVAAMATTFFHWGLHPWGIYALVSLALAFFAFNKKLPLSLRSVFYPLFGERVWGSLGDIIDTFAILATMLGLATSLGLGVQQINSGLNYLLGIEINVWVQVVLITVITGIAVISVAMGIDRGIKKLSRLNILLALVLMLAVFFLGPTLYVIRIFSNSLGTYISNLAETAFYIVPDGSSWQGEWSVFYLAWWISWSPFVGMFIARMSKGRTVREFIIGVLLVPSLLSFIWLSVFGGSAIHLDSLTGGSLFSVVQDNLPVALFEFIHTLNMPITHVLRVLLSILATLLVVSYFVTSSDSGSLVVDKISSGGKMKSPVGQRILWACLEGILAATLLLIGGERALDTLQTAVISSGLPLSVMIFLLAIALIKGLWISKEKQRNIRETKRVKDVISTID